MLYTILIFRDFIFKENALFTYFIVFFLYETVKTTESILNSDDIVYPFLIFRLFVFVLPKCVFLCSVLFFAQSITVVISIIFGVVVCEQYHVCPRNFPRTFRKMSTFNHETPHKQSVRRRGPIHCARIFTLSNIHIHFNKYAFSHYQMCVSVPHFAVVYISANTIKLCTNVHLQLAITQQHTQNAYFRIAKTILLQCKNHLFARQKPYFCNAKRGFLYNGIICNRM